MPVMPTSGATPANPNLSGSSSQQQGSNSGMTAVKIDVGQPSVSTVQLQPQQASQGMKQIAICVAPSISGSLPLTAQAARTSTMSGQTALTTSTQSPTTAFFTNQTQLSNLGLMVTRFPSDNRVGGATQQLVLSRPQQLTTTVRPGGVVVTTSNASGISGQNTARIMHVANLPTHQAIRTIVQPSQSGSGNIQVMNLSVSNPTSTASTGNQMTIKQSNARGPFNTFPVEAVNMIVSNDPNTGRIVNVKPGVPTTGGAIKISRTGGPTVVGQQTKVISLTTNPVPVHSVTPQQVTRLGIIQPTSTAGKAGQIINIAMPKNQAVIINPSNHHQTVTPQVVGSFTTTSQLHHKTVGQQHPQHTMIPVLPSQSVMTIAGMHGRHAIIPAGTAISTAQFSGQHQRIITANPSMLSHHHQQSAQFHSSSGQVVSLTPGSPMKQVNPSPLKATQQQQSGTPSSPRPSILTRKRVGDSPASSSVARNLNKAYQEIKSAADKPCSTTIVHHPHDMHRIQQLLDQSQSSSQEQGLSGTTTPRKKPRKQLLEPFSHISALSSGMKLMTDSTQFNASGDMNLQRSSQDYSEDVLTDDANSQEEEEDYEIEDDEEDQGVPSPQTLASTRKPRLSLLTTYGSPWKSLQYHFLRYSDVKPKAEKKLTLSELSNEGLQKKNGWKIHHLATQMEDMSESEGEIFDRLNSILSRFEEKVSPLPGLDDAVNPDLPVKVTISDKLTDLIRGNLQRSNVFQEQMNESRSLLIKLTNDHREKIGRVTRKNINKRTCISK